MEIFTFFAFTLFGQNQLFMLGFITLLLLFRYIRKIKIGDLIDIKFGKLETHLNNLVTATDDAIIALKRKTLAESNLTSIRDELMMAKGNLENIKAKALRTS